MSEWVTRRLKTVLKETKDTVGTKSADYQLLSLTKGGVIIRDISTGKGKFPSDFGTYKIVRDGQIIFCLFDIDETPRTVGLSHHNGMITGAYDVFNIVDANSRFIEYYFLAIDDVKGLKPYYTGLRKVVSIDKFLNIRISLPPRPEQDQIVRYLDWKVSRVNRLINAKKKQIGLLVEMVDNLTNRAINETKKRTRLKYIVKFLRDPILRICDDEYKPVGVLNRGRGVFHKQVLSGGDLGDSEFFHTCPNALLISGQFAWEGAIALTEQTEFGCITSHRYYTIKAKEDICYNEYLWAYFQTKLGDTVLNLCSHGAAGRNKPLNFSELLNEFIPLPAEKTQQQICTAVRKLMVLRQQNRKHETLLHEYRARLISDVVTGKLDVRGVAVPEFEAVEEAAEEDDVSDDETEEADEE